MPAVYALLFTSSFLVSFVAAYRFVVRLQEAEHAREILQMVLRGRRNGKVA